MPNPFLSEYFSFTKKERNGIIVLIVMIILVAILPLLFPFFIKQKTYDHSVFEKEIAALKFQQDSSQKNAYRNFDDDNFQYRESSSPHFKSNAVKGELFEFDPNTLEAGGWKRLGVRDKTIATIQNYVNKGGRFRQPQDIGKIWGLHPDEVERLLPYIKIIATENKYVAGKNDESTFEKRSYVKEKRQVEINNADSSALIELPGIGSGFARRIINFRNKLGGFVSVDQIGETYGLPDSTFQKIKPRLSIDNNAVKQININTATIDELKPHPYIRYALANAIIQYRAQHGNYASVDDIKKIMMVTDEIFNKVLPYLKTTD